MARHKDFAIATGIDVAIHLGASGLVPTHAGPEHRHSDWVSVFGMSQHPKSAQYAGMAAGLRVPASPPIEGSWLFAWVCRCVDVIMERCCGTIDL
jgi:hypothetical protein